MHSRFHAAQTTPSAGVTTRRTRRCVAAAVPVAMVVAMVVTPAVASASTHTAAAPAVVAADPAAQAARQAAASGQRVELTAETTAYNQTFVNPDGSRTLVQHSEAQRVRRAGEWVGVDTTLRIGADGRVSPVASAVDVSFSGGGNTAMVAVGKDNVTLALTWPGALPTPVLAGDTATYPEVLPGVDLQLKASAESYSQVLVVKNAAAAVNPDLARFTLKVAPGAGDKVVAAGDGGFTVVDTATQNTLTSPAPIMWDSRGSTGATTTGADGAQVDTKTGAEIADHNPKEGDKTTPIHSTVTATAVTLVPDATLLTDTATKYPVFIDPTVGAGQRIRQMVNRSYPTSTEGTNWGGDEGMGYNSYSGVNMKRLFWNYDTTGLGGAQILGSTFSAFQTFAATCAVSQVNMISAEGFSEARSWNTQPPLMRQIDSRSVANGRSGCNPGGALVEFNATSLAQDVVNNGWGNVSIALAAANEGDNNAWKRFRGDATFSITYNNPPNVPLSLHLQNPQSPCVTGVNRPVIGVPNPQMIAYAADPNNDNMTGYFEYWHTGGSQIGTVPTQPVPANTAWAANTPNLPDGIYSYRAITQDTSGAYSPYTGWCEFQIDTVAPVMPVASPVTPGDGNVDSWYAYTVSPGTSTNVVAFEVTLNSDAPSGCTAPTAGSCLSTTPGQPQKLSVIPLTTGPNVVRFWSYNAAGTPSPVSYNTLKVNASLPVGYWRLDEASGGGVDQTGGRTLTPTGGVTRDVGISGDSADRSMLFDGTTGYASTDSAMVDTSHSFSMSAWVNLTDLTRSQTAVGVDGYQLSRAWLGYDATTGNFTFTLPQSDSTSAPLRTAQSAQPAVTGEWDFLVGSYNADTGQMALYVNQESAVTTPAPNAWDAPGYLRVGTNTPVTGRAVTDQQRWQGGVDEVRVWSRTVPSDEVVRLANPYLR